MFFKTSVPAFAAVLTLVSVKMKPGFECEVRTVLHRSTFSRVSVSLQVGIRPQDLQGVFPDIDHTWAGSS